MAKMIKILKNMDPADVIIANHTIEFSIPWMVLPSKWIELAEDDDIEGLITSGDIVVNDGTNDLSVSDGIKWVKTLADEDSSSIGGIKISGVPDNGDIIQYASGPNQLQYVAPTDADFPSFVIRTDAGLILKNDSGFVFL